jgi:bifunctional non-homologous end joining protein LigD
MALVPIPPACSCSTCCNTLATICARPLLERKALLKEMIAGSERIRFVDHIDEEGANLFAVADKLELGGIVGKRADATYPRGRSGDWVKIKTAHGRDVDEERAKWNER